MRITRAAKVAAFPLIVLALVALIACQGPAGLDGKDGETGETGETGMEGVPGMDAPIPLTGRDGVVIDSLDAGKDEDEATEMTIDLHADGYFNGGMAPFTYKVTGITDSDGSTAITPADDAKLVTGAIDDDTGMLKLKLNASPSPVFDDGDYMVGFTVALSAEDANKESATLMLTIKPNRAPQNAAGVSDTDGVLSGDNVAYVIGTQEGEIDTNTGEEGNQPRTEGASSCATFNSCVLTLFADQDDYDLSVVADPAGHFSWEDQGEGKLLLTGLTGMTDPIEVDVTATDSDMQSRTLRFNVTVDAAPTASDEGAAVQRSITLMPGDTYSVLGATQDNIVGAFKDDQTVAVAFTTANNLIATVDGSSGQVTAQAKGTTTVTATGTTGGVDSDTNGLGQSVKIEFTITVN